MQVPLISARDRHEAGMRSEDDFEEPPGPAFSLPNATHPRAAGYASDSAAATGKRSPAPGHAALQFRRMQHSVLPPRQAAWATHVFARTVDKNVSRAMRKARTKRHWPEEMVAEEHVPYRGRLAAYCTCDVLHTDVLVPALPRIHQQQARMRIDEHRQPQVWSYNTFLDTVHSYTEGKDVFYIPYGCIVFWGMTDAEELAILQQLKPFQEEEVEEVASDDITFMTDTRTRIHKDSVALATNDPAEKLAVSYAMAQSVKLSVFEDRVMETIANTRHVPQVLSETGSINLSQTEISKQIGRLFIESHSVNLNDVLATPEYFWESGEFEHVYGLVSKYLEVESRVEVLNRRLDIIRELLNMLNDQLNNQHASKLELIVIWLIVIEVVISVFWNIIIKDVLQWF